MKTTHLDGEALKEMLLHGLMNLKLHSDEVDRLNVFPVPDGDTGTNMSMTLEGGAGAVRTAYFESVSEFAAVFSKGTLLGARGNSGVILSQFVKGLGLGLEGKKTVSVTDFVKAFRKGVEKAYDAVINPTEGTMLTVMREGCDDMEVFLDEHPECGFEELIRALCGFMKTSLDHTPELLPVLKEAGVIDSGGAGFLYIFEGVLKALNGEKIEAELSAAKHGGLSANANFAAFGPDSVLEYGYCTECIIQLQNAKVDIPSFDKSVIVDFLEKNGDSIVAVQDDDLVKLHVHTFRPGDVLNFCQQFGEFLTLKIENMSVQHNEILLEEERRTKEKIRKRIAIVAAVSGRGLQKYFQEIGVDVIVNGGQTDNPSAEDFVEAFSRIESEQILVLPCNSNIVMAASQAAELCSDRDIRVIMAKSVAEGYAALSMMNLSLSADEVVRDMEAAIAETATGLVTTATRDVEYEDLSVKEGHFIGLNGDKVLSDSEDRIEAACELLKKTEGIEDKVVVAAFYGKAVTPEELEKFEQKLNAEFPYLEYGFIEGGQDVYDYILAIE